MRIVDLSKQIELDVQMKLPHEQIVKVNEVITMEIIDMLDEKQEVLANMAINAQQLGKKQDYIKEMKKLNKKILTTLLGGEDEYTDFKKECGVYFNQVNNVIFLELEKQVKKYQENLSVENEEDDSFL